MIPLLARKRIAELVATATLCAGVALVGAMALAGVDAACAQDGGGAVSGQGNPAATFTSTPTPSSAAPSAPSGVSASVVNRRLSVSWTAAAGATS